MAFNRETFVLYDEEHHSGLVESINRVALDMNNVAGGVFSLSASTKRGEFERESFFKQINGMVRDRDPNDLTESTADDLVMSETTAVKIHKSFHVEKSVNSFAALGAETAQDFSFIVGQIQGSQMAVDYTDTAIAAATAALRSTADVQYDATAVTGKEAITPANLNRIHKTLGDQGGRIRAWVMNSVMFYDLVENGIEGGLETVAGNIQMYGGGPATLGLPAIVVDSPYLSEADEDEDTGPDSHFVLALTGNAVEVVESEAPANLAEVVGGLKNLVGRIQSEYAMNVKVSGYSYTGAAHPTRADLADSANWSLEVDPKVGIGAMGIFNEISDT